MLKEKDRLTIWHGRQESKERMGQDTRVGFCKESAGLDTSSGAEMTSPGNTYLLSEVPCFHNVTVEAYLFDTYRTIRSTDRNTIVGYSYDIP